MRNDIRNVFFVCLLLAAVTVAAFWPVTSAEFVNYDDPTYITDNLRVQQGLTLENVRWAFTTFYFSNWHPLTWLSYMLDCELFGVDLAFHVANAIVLFLVLNRLTRALLPSAAVAALFAVHPVHVESVAWISERKDVLSTFFWTATMWAYGKYAANRSRGWYGAVVLSLTLGLMAKPMLVTLPLVLLLLDIWPLRRIYLGDPSWRTRLQPLVFEKLPLFFLVAASSVLTLVAQRRAESVASFIGLPLSERLENAVISYARYLAKLFWPTDLAVFYPHPGDWPGFLFFCALSLLLSASVAAILTLRRMPAFFAGWFWFVGTLVPVIGIIQVGGQSMADRYAYIPSIGLFIAVVWAVRHFVLGKAGLSALTLFLSVAIIVSCAVITFRQASYWQNSVTLLTHAERVTPPSSALLNNLGDALLERGRIAEATEKFKHALRLDSKDSFAWGNLANLHFREGRIDEAISHYQAGLIHSQNNSRLHFNLGLALVAKGRLSNAVPHFERALALEPFYVDALLNLGDANMKLGNAEAGASNYLAALRLKSDIPAAHYNLGNARLAAGRFDEAIKHFQETIRLDPRFSDAYRQLAVALQRAGRHSQAVSPLQRAVEINPSSPGARAELAALLNELGRSRDAIAQYREALRRDRNSLAVLNNLAWILSTHPDPTIRDGSEAVRLAQRAVDLTSRQQPFLLGTLAAAYAEAGSFDQAVATAEEAVRLALRNGQNELASKNKELLGHYRQQRPWREPVQRQ